MESVDGSFKVAYVCAIFSLPFSLPCRCRPFKYYYSACDSHERTIDHKENFTFGISNLTVVEHARRQLFPSVHTIPSSGLPKIENPDHCVKCKVCRHHELGDGNNNRGILLNSQLGSTNGMQLYQYENNFDFANGISKLPVQAGISPHRILKRLPVMLKIIV
jgi:hypothetical protein